jgi:two-component system, response regulator / RNA-binding antiterminator
VDYDQDALADRIALVRADLEANARRLQDAQRRLADSRAAFRNGRSQREVLHESAYARLEARLATLPVIEQAKGILMARTGCPPDRAFEMLRSASQRTNVPIRDIATDIVQRTVQSGQSGETATPGRPPGDPPARRSATPN